LDRNGDAAGRYRSRAPERLHTEPREKKRRNGQAEGTPGLCEEVWADHLRDHGATREPRAARVPYDMHRQQTDRCRRDRGDCEEPARYGLDRTVASAGRKNGQMVLAVNVMSQEARDEGLVINDLFLVRGKDTPNNLESDSKT